MSFWQEGVTYRHRQSGTVHTITRIFEVNGERIADFESSNGPGQARLAYRYRGDFEVMS